MISLPMVATVLKGVQVKMQILGIGKTKPAFTLVELLVVLLIIGLASSIIFLNISSFSNNSLKSPIEESIYLIKEESILTGEIIALSLSDSQQQWSIISRDGNKKIIKKNTFNWGQLQSFTKTVETSSGSRVLLDNEMSLEPVIIFYPSGENTGAKLYFETIDKKLEIIISKNGKVIRANE